VADHPKPYVREELDARSMHFGLTEIQSRMQILRPHALALEYTRTMMGFLLWKPEPARIAMLGLGGGSIAKFCHRYLPNTSMAVVEINPHVTALRDAFEVPPDSPRFRIIEADGARFIAETHDRFDVLMVDAFDADGMPESLGTQRFYDDACDVLCADGLFAVNLHAGHPHLPVYIERIRKSFGGDVLRVDDSDGSNSVVFARKNAAAIGATLATPRRPPALAPEAFEQLRGAFSRIGHASREHQRLRDK
jgi:spermidine synthase